MMNNEEQQNLHDNIKNNSLVPHGDSPGSFANLTETEKSLLMGLNDIDQVADLELTVDETRKAIEAYDKGQVMTLDDGKMIQITQVASRGTGKAKGSWQWTDLVLLAIAHNYGNYVMRGGVFVNAEGKVKEADGEQKGIVSFKAHSIMGTGQDILAVAPQKLPEHIWKLLEGGE